jgi:hypothetical protein
MGVLHRRIEAVPAVEIVQDEKVRGEPLVEMLERGIRRLQQPGALVARTDDRAQEAVGQHFLDKGGGRVAAGDLLFDSEGDEAAGIETPPGFIRISEMQGKAGLRHQPALLCGKNRRDAGAFTINSEHLAGAFKHREEKRVTA